MIYFDYKSNIPAFIFGGGTSDHILMIISLLE